MDEQRSAAEGCRGYSGDDGADCGGGFLEMQGVKGMPFPPVHRNNRFAILEIEEMDERARNQVMPTDLLAVEPL